MATGIDQAIVLQFDDQVQAAFQQKVPRLRKFARIKTNVIGDQTSFDILGSTTANNITGQVHARTSWLDPQNTRSWAPKTDFNHPILLDWNTQQEILVDLQNGYAMNGAMSMARAADQLLLDAAIGTRFSGKTGGTSNSFDTTTVSADGTTGGLVANGSANLTVSKIRQVSGAFMAREVGVDDLQMGVPDAFVWVVSGPCMKSLLAQTEAISRDFVSGKPLEDGFVMRFMGFTFVISSLLSTVSSMRRTIAWHRSAMGYGIWKERDLTVDRLPDYNNALGIQYMMSMGATRVQDTGVIAIDCDETL